jgi:predicted metalloprotease with PDZ domain
LGKPPFDVEAEMSWTAKAYSYLGKSFRYLDPVPMFRVFMRVLDTQPVGGGTALTHSFMLSMGTNGPREGVEHIRGIFLHEMTHQWVGGMQGSVGETAWYEEGLTVYYSAVLPLRGGLESVDDYLNEVNQEARNYYQSPARNWSAAKIAEVGFADETIRHTPYARGALYFADLDWKIRQASHGKSNLDSFLYPIFVERQKGTPLTQQLWEKLLSKELGPQAVADFRGELVDGSKTLVPNSGAFGPCFQRESVGIKTSDGQVVTGYHWSRIIGTPDEKCRVW